MMYLSSILLCKSNYSLWLEDGNLFPPPPDGRNFSHCSSLEWVLTSTESESYHLEYFKSLSVSTLICPLILPTVTVWTGSTCKPRWFLPLLSLVLGAQREACLHVVSRAFESPSPTALPLELQAQFHSPL